MNILLLGKGGQVGWELQRSVAPLGHLTALDFDSTSHCGDFSNLQGLADTVRAVRPDVIVNAAAHTAVDKAESEPELARTLNALAPGVLAQEAATPAKRPHNSRLNTDKLQATFGLTLPPWQQGVDRMLAETL